MNKVTLTTSLLILFISGIPTSTLSQSLNFEEIFGSDWQKANEFLSENDSWIKPALEKNHIPYNLAIAIVFPELVRYSALRDKMEVSLLKTLYINLGDDYADFSIGPFQMKPSFAEAVREKAQAAGRTAETMFKEKIYYDDIKKFRSVIVHDLEDPVSQLNYLVAFIKICEKDFNGSWNDEQSKIRFMATAYNCGINMGPEKIALMIDRKFFNTKLFRTENYCYSDVGLFWYLNRK